MDSPAYENKASIISLWFLKREDVDGYFLGNID